MQIFKASKPTRQLDIYTDGACSSKTKMGGWGLVVVENDEVIYQEGGYEPYSTNNRMELMAILTALRLTDEIESANTAVTIYTDSAYCCNTFNQKWYANWEKNGWKTADKKDVKNQDLLTEMVALYIKNKVKHNIIISKVEGHSGIKYNEMVDAIAVAKRKELEI